MVRCVAITRRAFNSVLPRLLAVPLKRLNFESAPLKFYRRGTSRNNKTRRKFGDGVVQIQIEQSADNENIGNFAFGHVRYHGQCCYAYGVECAGTTERIT